MSEYKIALAQMAMSSEKNKNLIRSLTLLENAAEQGSDLILYPMLRGEHRSFCDAKRGSRIRDVL